MRWASQDSVVDFLGILTTVIGHSNLVLPLYRIRHVENLWKKTSTIGEMFVNFSFLHEWSIRHVVDAVWFSEMIYLSFQLNEIFLHHFDAQLWQGDSTWANIILLASILFSYFLRLCTSWLQRCHWSCPMVNEKFTEECWSIIALVNDDTLDFLIIIPNLHYVPLHFSIKSSYTLVVVILSQVSFTATVNGLSKCRFAWIYVPTNTSNIDKMFAKIHALLQNQVWWKQQKDDLS